MTDGGLYQLNGSRTAASMATGMQILNNVNINQAGRGPRADPGERSHVAVDHLGQRLAGDFKIPSQFRATLSTSYRANLGPLGDDWTFGLDGFYSRVDEVLITDIRSIPLTGVGSTTPDGRQRYRGLRNGTSGSGCR
ncbi:hypothetical protein AB5I41_06440 [Sphingomonas sp. MMS24-JH45]